MSAVCIGGCIGVSRSFITWTAKSHLSHLSHPHLRPLSWKSTKFGSPVFSLTRPRARSVSVSSIAQLTQQAVDVSSGFVAFAAKAYGILLLAVFLLQRKLIYLPSGQVADPRVYGGEVIQIAGDSGTTSAAMFFRPQGSKPTIVLLDNMLRVLRILSIKSEVIDLSRRRAQKIKQGILCPRCLYFATAQDKTMSLTWDH